MICDIVDTIVDINLGVRGIPKANIGVAAIIPLQVLPPPCITDASIINSHSVLETSMSITRNSQPTLPGICIRARIDEIASHP